MTIVIVSEYIDDKQNSTGFYWNSLIDLLSSEFTEVKVISTRKSIALYKKDNRNINFIAAPSFNFLEGNVFFKFLHDSLVALIFLSLSVKHLKKDDILFCGTNPSFLFLLLGLLKMLKRFKWVTLVHDIFPENTISAGILKKDSFTYNFLLKLSNISFQKNDEIICIGRDMKEVLNKKVKNLSKINYIPNFSPSFELSVDPNKEKRNKYITFTYFGNLGPLQGVDNLLDAFASVKSNNARFIFSGSGIKAKMVEEFCLKKDRMEFLSPSMFHEKEKILSQGDIAIIPLTKGMYGLAVPSKAYFSLASNKYIFVVGENNSELHRTIKENNDIGWFVDVADTQAITKEIDRICSEGNISLPKISRNSVKEIFEFNSVAHKYLEIFLRLS